MNPGYEISVLNMADLDEALAMVWSVFLEFEAPDYSTDGVREFRAFIDLDAMKQRIENEHYRMWVCKDHEKTIGVIATRPPCHISLLFVDRNHHRRGIARAMFDHMVECYQEFGGCEEITVNSSPYAKEVYRRLGFRETDSEQTVNGIRFIPMKRVIAADSAAHSTR